MARKYQIPELTIKNCEIPEVLNGSNDVQVVDVDMQVADLFW